jgi:uncharacterized phage protein gp47/JayE
MFEDMTYEALLQKKLDTIRNNFDKREGSIIYDALAPNSAEMAMMYIQLEWMFQQMFGDTAQREYLIKIAKDTRGIEPTKATNAILKGEFNIPVKIGDRFNLGVINYSVIDVLEDESHTYMLKCETEGIEGNKHLGTLIPIQYISGLTKCDLTEILIPGEEAEDTEDFRKRWRDSFNAFAFGGNRDDYKKKIKDIPGVGGCKCYRTTNEEGEKVGGHVKCLIIDANYEKPSDELVKLVQNNIDPLMDMEGDGLAPIGHIVHITGVKETIINFEATITYEEGFSFIDVKNKLEEVIDKFLYSLSKQWENSSQIVVRVIYIASAILEINGIQNIQNILLNGLANDITLNKDAIPVRGDVIG